MEYIGAADYYFYQGIQKAIGRSINDFQVPTIFGHTDVSRACQDAYSWGYCLGLQLSQDEYNDLTGPIKPNILEETIKEVIAQIENLESEANIKIEGNC